VAKRLSHQPLAKIDQKMTSSQDQLAFRTKYKLSLYYLDREMEIYHNYLHSTDKQINEKIRKVELRKNKLTGGHSSAGPNFRLRRKIMDLGVELKQLTSFKILLSQSFITMLYSFFEISILRECYLDSKYKDHGEAYGQIKGKGIIKAKNYFRKVMKIDFTFETNDDWKWINKLRLLRDCIIHRQGSLSGFSSINIDVNLEKFINSEKGLSLVDPRGKLISIDTEFCDKSLIIVKRLISEILLSQYKLIYEE
jgi:hypothetical protein